MTYRDGEWSTRNGVLLIVMFALTSCSGEQPTVEVSVEPMNTNSDPIVVEQTFNAPISSVWTAITDETQMPQWFFEPITKFEPRIGFETQFTVVVEDKEYLHIWNVTDVVPERRIVYDWRYGGFPGDSTVTWELAETSDGTSLRLTHSGHETFPQDDPNFSREAGVAGWTYFIRESLKQFLEEQN